MIISSIVFSSSNISTFLFPHGYFDAGEDGVVVEERITDGSVAGPWCSLPCRSIRIGNYKVRMVNDVIK